VNVRTRKGSVEIPLAVVGVSHETAPVDVRERVAYDPAEASEVLTSLRREEGFEEAVLLSTCNRTEVYVFPARADATLASVERALSRKASSVEGGVGRYLFRKDGDEAVRHLFGVTAGLDSLVTGESEIQGQVRDAYQRAAEGAGKPPFVGPVMNRLFQMALSAGGQVRSQTSIGEGSASVASVAVELARKIFGSLHGKRVLVLGAGLTGELIVEALGRQGAQSVVVANRTYDRAVSLARKHRGHAIRFDEIAQALSSVDIVLSSTAAPHPVLTRAILRESFASPRRHPLLIIDVAIPRDVDPAVGDEPGVFLYNVDDLRKIVEEHVHMREGAFPAARAIIQTRAEEFETWYASLQVVPVIRQIRERAEAARRVELDRLFEGMEHLTPEDRSRVEEFSRRLQNKLLHEPTTRLRKGMTEGEGGDLVDTVRFLYSLDDPNPTFPREGGPDDANMEEGLSNDE
jgi:glutamyl-tRNA reductase